MRLHHIVIDNKATRVNRNTMLGFLALAAQPWRPGEVVKPVRVKR